MHKLGQVCGKCYTTHSHIAKLQNRACLQGPMRQVPGDGDSAAAPDAAASRPPPPPSPPAPSANMPRADLARKMKLLVEEHATNKDDGEARQSAADMLEDGASPGQVYAQLLVTLTAKHKQEAEYAERFSALLEVRPPPTYHRSGVDGLFAARHVLLNVACGSAAVCGCMHAHHGPHHKHQRASNRGIHDPSFR